MVTVPPSADAADGAHHSKRQVLIIIGMHRSGTSATTGALRCLGVPLGKRLYSAHEQINAKGYFEHSDIADANDAALLAMGTAWDDVLPRRPEWWLREELLPHTDRIRHYIRRDFSGAALWAIKDPRICRLLPWWLDILAGEQIAPCLLFVVRSAEAVARSLQRRDGFSRDKSIMLWLLHYLEAERDGRGYPRAFMMFDEFIEDPISNLLRVESQLGIRFPVAVSSAETCLKQFLSPDLHHHKGRDESQSQQELDYLADRLEGRLREAASATGKSDRSLYAEDISQALDGMVSACHPVLLEHLRSTACERGRAELTVRRMMHSWFWTVGKPLRFIERLLGREV